MPYDFSLIFPTGFLKEFLSPLFSPEGFLGGVFSLQYTDDELIKGGVEK
jgi:hypothetical protein